MNVREVEREPLDGRGLVGGTEERVRQVGVVPVRRPRVGEMRALGSGELFSDDAIAQAEGGGDLPLLETGGVLET